MRPTSQRRHIRSRRFDSPTIRLFVRELVQAKSWWRHQMETFSTLLALCAGNSPVTGEFPSQRSMMQSVDNFFDVHLNKRLSKQSRHWWFEQPSRSLQRHRKVRRNTNGLNYRPFVSKITIWKVGGLFSQRANNAHVVLDVADGKWEWRVWHKLMAELISSECWKGHKVVMEIKELFNIIHIDMGLFNVLDIWIIANRFLYKNRTLINMVRKIKLQIPLPWGR